MTLNEKDELGVCSFLFHSALNEEADLLLDEIKRIGTQSPFRKMQTCRGMMSVEMTNCGEIGWLSDTRGYRYTKIDPLTKKPWPPMEAWVSSLAIGFARTAGFSEFWPNVCLINRYVPGTRTYRLRYHGITKVYDAELQTGMHERLVMTFRYSRLWQTT